MSLSCCSHKPDTPQPSVCCFPSRTLSTPKPPLFEVSMAAPTTCLLCCVCPPPLMPLSIQRSVLRRRLLCLFFTCLARLGRSSRSCLFSSFLRQRSSCPLLLYHHPLLFALSFSLSGLLLYLLSTHMHYYLIHSLNFFVHTLP